MKKLIFATALTIGSLAAVSASSATMYDGIMDVVISEEFKEISVDQVPAAVTEALATAYAGAVIDRAYVNEKEEYKIEITAEEGTKATLYADSEGNWLELEES